MYTCRGHTAPVLCVALLTVSPTDKERITPGRSSPLETALENNFAFSGSLDGEIRSWRLGNLQLMLYEAFDPSVAGPMLRGHSDAVWCIATRVRNFNVYSFENCANSTSYLYSITDFTSR